MSLQDIKLTKSLLNNANNIVIVSHENPDGDTIGSSLALMLVLKNMGKKVNVVINDDLPEFLKWIPGANEYLVYENNPNDVKQVVESSDLIFLVDFNDLDRMGKMKTVFSTISSKKCVMIDHHPDPKEKCNVMFSFPGTSSTAELVYDFFVNLEFDNYIDKEVATCIYTGIITDTGNFAFNSSSPHLFEVVSALLSKGVEKDDIYNKVYNNFSYDRMRLVGLGLHKRLVYWEKYNTAFIYYSKTDLVNYNHQKGDTENIVNIPMSIKGVFFSLLLIEKDDYVKMSFRSKGNFPANYIAKKYFNGGGHLNAAGGRCYKSLKETIEDLKKVLENDEIIKGFFDNSK